MNTRPPSPRVQRLAAAAAALSLLVGGLVLRPAAAQSYSGQGSVEQRLQRLERLVEGRGLTGLMQRVDELQRDLQRLQGDNEVQDHKLDLLSRQQRDLKTELQQRLAATTTEAADPAGEATPASMGGSIVTTAPTEPAETPLTPAPTVSQPSAPTVTTTTAPQQQQRDYRQAFQLLRDGEYQPAIIALELFVQSYPNGQYSANAQYWIGEAYYVEHQFKPALQAFRKTVEHYPDSGKSADALLKIGFIRAEQHQPDAARQTFNRVIERYPDSTAATLARERLKQM